MDTVKNFFKNRKAELVLFLALLLAAIFSGVNFGLLLGLTLFFWATGIVAEIPKGGKALSVILRVLVIGVFCASTVGALMNRSYQKRWIALGRFDQFISWKIGDQNIVKSSDLWEIEKEKNSEKFRKYYRNLLAQGKTKEAADTLIGFSKAWDLDEKLEKSSSEDEEPTQPVITLPVPVNSSESMTLHKGESWCPNHVFQKGEKVIYTIEYASIKHRASGGPRIIQPGRYEEKVSEAGLLAFDGFEKLSKITVYY